MAGSSMRNGSISIMDGRAQLPPEKKAETLGRGWKRDGIGDEKMLSDSAKVAWRGK